MRRIDSTTSRNCAASSSPLFLTNSVHTSDALPTWTRYAVDRAMTTTGSRFQGKGGGPYVMWGELRRDEVPRARGGTRADGVGRPDRHRDADRHDRPRRPRP